MNKTIARMIRAAKEYEAIKAIEPRLCGISSNSLYGASVQLYSLAKLREMFPDVEFATKPRQNEDNPIEYSVIVSGVTFLAIDK